MKKILLAIAIILTLGFNANAQRNDAFFNTWSSSNDDSWRTTIALTIPSGGLGAIEGDPSGAPLGSGILVLTALGAGYAAAKKKRS